MPELGKYAGAVLSSYGLSLGLIALLVGVSIWRSRRVARALRDIEGRVKNG
ncbi:heme exporter protein CcmD [Pseudooceanicola sp. C21-150M6]|uniref:heme exporter protein CcmD n=1 Tax=Pseudooceanicola sp. C21-150M6 TaxID=3434355 RepID=UPI003D7FAB9F